MTILTLASKGLGFLREMVIAYYYGASYITDSYVMANAIPGIIFGGIFGAIATAYMPLYAKFVEQDGEIAGNKFTSESVNLLLVVSVVSSIVGIVFSDQLVAIFASGFTGETARLTSFFVKVTFTYTAFSSIAGILEAYLQYKGSFLPAILSGYLLSGSTIVVVVISAFTSHYYLAFGMLVGYIARMIIMWHLSHRKQYRYTPEFHFGSTTRTMMVLALPVFLGSTVGSINLFVDRTMASGLREGSISALNYSALITGMVVTVTVGVLTTMIYPKLNQASAQDDQERFNSIISMGMNLAFLIGMPFTLGTMAYSEQVAQIIYERGAFDVNATAMTGSALFYYGAGLLFSAIAGLLVRVYYSMGNTKTPTIFGALCIVVNIVFILLLIKPMAHNGLALSTSIAGMVNTVLLYWGLHRYYPHVVLISSRRKLALITIASGVSVGASLLCYRLLILPLAAGAAGPLASRTLHLTLAVAVAGVLYLALLALFRVEELQLLRHLKK